MFLNEEKVMGDVVLWKPYYYKRRRSTSFSMTPKQRDIIMRSYKAKGYLDDVKLNSSELSRQTEEEKIKEYVISNRNNSMPTDQQLKMFKELKGPDWTFKISPVSTLTTISPVSNISKNWD